MLASPEAQPNIYVSQIPYLLPGRAMREASKLQIDLGLNSIGVELHPLRWHSSRYLFALKKETGVQTAIAGVTTESYKHFGTDLWNFRSNPKVIKEILMNIAVVGAQSEPSWARRFGTHLQIAVSLGASYLAMHEGTTTYLERKGKLEQWISTPVLYGRKLGWGPQDNRPQALSWDIYAIRDFINEWKGKGKGNIGAILPADTALRTGLSLPDPSKQFGLKKAWEVLQPRVIQVGDYKEEGKREKLVPGEGNHKDELANLIQESSRESPVTIYTVEVERPEDVRRTIEFVLENYRGK